MKRAAMGNGTNQCILCGDSFGVLGAASFICHDCRKVCDLTLLILTLWYYDIALPVLYALGMKTARSKYQRKMGVRIQICTVSLIDVTEVRINLKLIYDRQSVGQSVLVSGAHLGPVTNFSFSLKCPSDSCVFVILWRLL
jgi:hypothetical protein